MLRRRKSHAKRHVSSRRKGLLPQRHGGTVKAQLVVHSKKSSPVSVSLWSEALGAKRHEPSVISLSPAF